MSTYWVGDPPDKCQLMGEPIIDVFIDGAVLGGSWACMCPKCHQTFGVGLGEGKGQKYIRQSDGKWLKEEGHD